MAKVPSFTKILREKFPGDLPWINNLLQPINSFMNDVKQASENRFTKGENFDGEADKLAGLSDGFYMDAEELTNSGGDPAEIDRLTALGDSYAVKAEQLYDENTAWSQNASAAA